MPSIIEENKADKHYKKADKYYEEDNYDKALDECDKAIEIAPDDSESHNMRGVILVAMDRIDEAIMEYKEALHLDPSNKTIKKNLAEIIQEQTKLSKVKINQVPSIPSNLITQTSAPNNANYLSAKHKWEYSTVYVVLTSDFQFMTKVGNDIVSGPKVWDYLNSLGQKGWELVSVVERIGNQPPVVSAPQNSGELFDAMMVDQSTLTATQHSVVTLGYFYIFKRVVQNTYKKCPYCAELIEAEADVCKYCGKDLKA